MDQVRSTRSITLSRRDPKSCTGLLLRIEEEKSGSPARRDVTKLTRVSGLAVVRAILGGERDRSSCLHFPRLVDSVRKIF